jgi:uncharacterized sulfatase
MRHLQRYRSAVCALLLTLLAALCTAEATQAQAARPNILFILTDDQGPWTPGYTGNAQSHTPNLDRLAVEGVRFENAFVTTPVCSPSRSTLMTGRYASELGIPDWIQPSSDQGLDPALPVWPALLREAGYRTGLVGKWHLGHRPEFHPTRYGYDYFMGFLTGGTKTADPTLEIDGEDRTFTGLTMDIHTDHAIAFLEQDDPRPFLLSLHFRAPHGAYLPVSDEDWAHFAERPMLMPKHPGLDMETATRRMREYLASVAGIDRNLGRIFRVLEERGVAENTIVIYTSDHGYNQGHHGIWGKGNGVHMLEALPPQRWPNISADRRPNMWDNSLRTPVVVRWPGVVKPGSVVTKTTTNLDWFPTLCAMAGVEIPRSTVLRGRSIVPLLDASAKEWENAFYAEYDMTHGALTHMRAWRTPEWKLMRDFKNPGRAELYDLSADPEERVNLIESTDPEAVRIQHEFDAKIRARMKEIDDPVLALLPSPAK